jgi:hypothetical protein
MHVFESIVLPKINKCATCIEVCHSNGLVSVSCVS